MNEVYLVYEQYEEAQAVTAVFSNKDEAEEYANSRTPLESWVERKIVRDSSRNPDNEGDDQ